MPEGMSASIRIAKMPAPENPASIHLTPELDAISERLVSARLDAEALPTFPGSLPRELESAYAIQRASISRWPDEVAGWKVGMVAPEYRHNLAAERLAGPVFAQTVFRIEPGERITMPIYSGGFAAVEAEFIFVLADTIEPVARDYSDDDLMQLIAELRVGAEIASSPMAEVNNLGPCSIVSDFGNNAGLIVGPSVQDWSTLSPDDLPAEVTVDGERVGSATARAIKGGLLQALRFLIEVSAIRGISLAKGTYISCGAVTGIHDVTADSKATVDFGPYGAFDVDFAPILPRQARAVSAKA